MELVTPNRLNNHEGQDDFVMMPRGKVNPREANRMMQRMGMQVSQLDDVTRVIMESPTRRIVIDDPEVATVTVQGQTVYQVGGGTVREEGIGGGTDDDAKLVAAQAGVPMEKAVEALKQSNGDLAQAIILLKMKRIP